MKFELPFSVQGGSKSAVRVCVGNCQSVHLCVQIKLRKSNKCEIRKTTQ